MISKGMSRQKVIDTISSMTNFDVEELEEMTDAELDMLWKSQEIDAWYEELDREQEMFQSNEGFGGSGFGGGSGGFTTGQPTTPTPTPTPTPNPTPAPTPAPTQQANPYGNKKTVPAKKITDLPPEFLEELRKLKETLAPELQNLGIIGPTLSQFQGIEPCPPCHLFIPPTNPDDENDTGTCLDQCEEDERCVNGVCDKPPEPKCKPTMRFEIDTNDRMCRVDAFNMVDADAYNDDGFTFSIEGQNDFSYSHIVMDRTVSLSRVSGLRLVATQQAEDNMVQNYTAGSGQPRPRKFSSMFEGIGYRLPSVTAESIPVSVMVASADDGTAKPANFNFYRDTADNLYLECKDLKVGENYNGTFIVQLQYQNLHQTTYDMSTFRSETMTFKQLKAKAQANAGYLPSMPALNAKAVQSADAINTFKGYSEDKPIKEVYDAVVGWLGGFSCEGIPKRNNSNLPAELYMNTSAGACRHRAFMAFLIFNRLGLPTRYCTSSCHAWPEIWDYKNQRWAQIDLGGCGDDDDEDCPPCYRANPLYGSDPDEPMCLPIECPENYYCDPRYGKCIPDCAELFPDGGHHYNPKTNRCEECPDGRIWNEVLEICECEKCPDGFTFNGKNCVDDEGNVSEDAPLGFYADRITDLCLPIPDCATDRPGTIFNESTGLCECPDGVNPLDLEAPPVSYKWSDEQGKCIPDQTKICPPGEWWDEVVGRCRPIPDRVIPIRQIPTEEEPEVLEDVIIEDGRVRESLTGWLNPRTGEIIDKADMMRAGENEASVQSRGYTVKWEMMRVAKGGNTSMPISNTLQGIVKWIEAQGMLAGVEGLAGWSRTPPMNRLIYMQGTAEDADFKNWVEGWDKAIQNAFPQGRFTVQSSTNRMEIRDSKFS